MMRAKYLKLLHWLCRRELQHIADKYPQTREELVRYHDFMAIACINAETPSKERILGISVNTARMLEAVAQPAPGRE
jgi:hypothetical protein